MNVDVTVAICTWNRADLLDQTLAHFRGLSVPAGVTWELLVVDNNSTDHTPAVLVKYADQFPLRALHEAKQGHSHARNKAVAEARGRLLLWTDDDVLVDANWMAEYLRAADTFPDAPFFGGLVRPWFEKPPPAWVTRHLKRISYCWALVDLGPTVRPFAKDEYPVGANLGFRTDVLRQHPFDPMYGRVGTRLTSGDEARVIDQIRAAGSEGVWVGSAVVDHFLPAARMTTGYVYEINRWAGYYGYEPFVTDRSPRFAGAPRWVWKRHLAAAAKALVLSPSKNDAWLTALLEQAKWRGLIDRFRATEA
ncbi:glycosyltransferase [Fimbriiglobus ruber]|uniref:Putative glycosyl transferase n=1 Tax=Fimbriiglobus ruber TaxID=1908690 RepID=A0A225DRJ1_9BACT|nr:glycosyltransferase [Fimbriiglobus ruber]OWK43713.1 putative glycosyl transferase [Fimbriiglobus ruber]